MFQARRQFRTLSRTLQAQVLKESTPKKKSHPFRKFVFRLTFATGLLYGLGAYIATQNDQFGDYFTEYVPFADEVVEIIEKNKRLLTETDLADLRKKISELKDKTVTVPEKGATVAKINQDYKDKMDEVGKEVVKAVDAALPTLYSTGNGAIDEIVDKVNTLITAINNNKAEISEDSVKTLQMMFASVNKKIAELEKQAFEYSAKLKESSSEEAVNAKATALFKKLEKERLGKMYDEFNTEIDKIKSTYEKMLQKDSAAFKEAQELEFANKLEAAKAEIKKNILSQIEERVESERDNKLKQLNALFEKVDKLEKLEVSLAENFDKFANYNEIVISMNNLKKKIFNPETYRNNLQELNGVKINEEIQRLEKLLTTDLSKQCIESLPSLSKTGLLSNAQLQQRWELLVPELRSAALLPPNAGLLGHLSAKMFSYLLIPKAGKVDGTDIESVISNVNYKLKNGDLDDAIEIVSSLKGWTRKLSNDWLLEARKKLEYEFLVDLLEAEIKYSY